MLLIAAFVSMPYGYYVLLRLVEFVSCCVIIIHSVKKNSMNIFTLLFGVFGLVFNPIFKVPFPKDVWAIVDIGAMLLWGIFFLHRIMKKR